MGGEKNCIPGNVRLGLRYFDCSIRVYADHIATWNSPMHKHYLDVYKPEMSCACMHQSMVYPPVYKWPERFSSLAASKVLWQIFRITREPDQGPRKKAEGSLKIGDV